MTHDPECPAKAITDRVNAALEVLGVDLEKDATCEIEKDATLKMLAVHLGVSTHVAHHLISDTVDGLETIMAQYGYLDRGMLNGLVTQALPPGAFAAKGPPR